MGRTGCAAQRLEIVKGLSHKILNGGGRREGGACSAPFCVTKPNKIVFVKLVVSFGRVYAPV
jgi:hypothetical protein